MPGDADERGTQRAADGSGRPRPPWWPEDEPWPPRHWGPSKHWGPSRHWRPRGGADGVDEGHEGWHGPPWWGPRWRAGHGDVRRGFGCLIVLLATLIVSIGVLVLWLLAGLLGLASLEGALADLARPAGLVTLAVGLVTLVVGIRVARSVGRPLTELVDAAGRIEAADYSVRVSEAQMRGDLRRVMAAFNAMAARLEAEDASRRRLLADVSHELRTPLAVVQGNVEALLDGVYPADEAHIRPILDETRVLERLVDDLRTLSLAESGALPLHREPTDPVVLLEDVAAAHRARAAEGRVVLRVEVAGTDDAGRPPSIDVDPVRFHQVLSNLVDNALRAMPDGGSIVLSAAAPTAAAAGAGEAPGAGGVILEVSDDGPGIPPDIRDGVFERFTKSASSRGSGLGLAIARAIVEAHGGTIAARPGGPAAPQGHGGPGTTIRIHLP